MVEEVLEFTHLPYHSGISVMLTKLREKFWIPNLIHSFKKFVNECDACLKVKSQRTDPAKPVMQTVSPHPWMSCHGDLIGPLPTSHNGNKYVLVVIDSLTRFMEVEPIKDKTAESTIIGFTKIFTRRGAPMSLLCDNGLEFRNQYLKDLMKSFGTNLQHCTPLQPASNGLVERANQKLKRYFKLWSADSLNWEDHLGIAAYVINMEYNRSIQTSAWSAYHGWTPQTGCTEIVNPMEIHAEFTGSQCLAHAKRHVQKMNRALAELVETDYKQKNNRFERLRTDYSKLSGSKFQLSRGDHVLVKIMQPKGMCGKFYIPVSYTHLTLPTKA